MRHTLFGQRKLALSNGFLLQEVSRCVTKVTKVDTPSESLKFGGYDSFNLFHRDSFRSSYHQF